MTFVEMRTLMLNHFQNMVNNDAMLFEVDVDKDTLWNLYLDGFPAGKNPIFRERREHDCSCCRHFIKTLGNVVTIQDGKVVSLWDFNIDGDDTYEGPIKAMREYIHSRPICNPFYTKEKNIGTKQNIEFPVGSTVGPIAWDHFYAEMPERFVIYNNDSKETKQAELRDIRNVFKRSLDELTEESVNIVLELIAQGSLYRGDENKPILEKFHLYQLAYKTLTDEQKEIFAWEFAKEAGNPVGKIRNHAIGTLLVNISEGMSLDTAVGKYLDVTAPSNYKRPKSIFTQQMLNDAKKTITELGYMNSLKRRYATLDDITVNNILFTNKDSAKRITGGDIFDEMAASVAVNPKKFDKVEEIAIEDFISNILPNTQELEILFENRLAPNMVSLIAPEIKDSKTMFKWNNNFSWAYSGNMTDSMKERVKAAGGNVTGDLRFSIQWNEDGKDNCDLDAHCITPINGDEIYYGHKRSATHGELDVDIIHPDGRVAVENITWSNRNNMRDGVYKFYVHQYSGSVKNGFRAEIEFDGQIYSFNYSHSMRYKEKVVVAEVTLKDGRFTIKPILEEGNVSGREVWGLNTNQFVPVSVVTYSPNYWDEQNGIGNKHYFFMLKNCVNTESPNGFYNEFLDNSLDKHKRVMEALGSKLAVVDADDQLSGVGFCSTKRNFVVAKVKGTFERTLKIMF